MDNLSSLACRRMRHPTDRINCQTNTGMALLQPPVAGTSKNNGTSESPPSQLLQPHQTHLISADTLGGACISLQQIPSTPSLPGAPLSSCTATPDPVLMLFLLQKNWKMMVILHRMNTSEGFSGFSLTGTFLGLCISRNSAFTDWDYLRSSIILVTQQSFLLQIYLIHFK